MYVEILYLGNHPFEGLFYSPIDSLHMGSSCLVTKTGKAVSFCRKSEVDWDCFENMMSDAHTTGSPFYAISNDAGDWQEEWSESDFGRMLSPLSDDEFIWVFYCHI